MDELEENGPTVDERLVKIWEQISAKAECAKCGCHHRTFSARDFILTPILGIITHKCLCECHGSWLDLVIPGQGNFPGPNRIHPIEELEDLLGDDFQGEDDDDDGEDR